MSTWVCTSCLLLETSPFLGLKMCTAIAWTQVFMLAQHLLYCRCMRVWFPVLIGDIIKSTCSSMVSEYTVMLQRPHTSEYAVMFQRPHTSEYIVMFQRPHTSEHTSCYTDPTPVSTLSCYRDPHTSKHTSCYRDPTPMHMSCYRDPTPVSTPVSMTLCYRESTPVSMLSCYRDPTSCTVKIGFDLSSVWKNVFFSFSTRKSSANFLCMCKYRMLSRNFCPLVFFNIGR